MKKLMMFAILAFVVVMSQACAQSSPTGASSPVSTSAGSALPSWMFAYDGHLVRPQFTTYPVYAGPEITNKLELRQHLEQALAAASALTDGRVRFVLTSDPNALISYRIDPSNPHVAPGANYGWGEYRPRTDYISYSDHIVIRDEEWFMTNVPLHELGHFIFGPGHSDTAGDIMSVSRDYHRMSFSDHEKSIWNQSLAFQPGATL